MPFFISCIKRMFKHWPLTFPPNVNKTNLSHQTTYAKSLVHILMEIQVLRWDMYKTVAGLKWLMGSNPPPPPPPLSLSLSINQSINQTAMYANTKRVRNKNWIFTTHIWTTTEACRIEGQWRHVMWLLFNANSAIYQLYQEQVNCKWDDDAVSFVLYQHA